jgi:hypothetical protein
MKLTSALFLTLSTLFVFSSAAEARSLGEVIGDTLRGAIRDDIGDSVRRDICRRREEQNSDGENQNDDFCEAWEDIDRLGDALRRGSNGIRAIDAIFN